MASSAASSLLVAVVVLVLVAAAEAAAANETSSSATAALRAGRELRRYRRVQALLRRVNKPAVRTIESPDGDLIDCVAAHLQPAFDHPRLRGQRPLRGPPERPRGWRPRPGPNDTAAGDAGVQLWASSAGGASCPEGSVPIRRTTEADVLRASSVRRFGRAPTARVRRDSVSGGHEHAVGYVAGEEYYGAKASINVWAPKVSTPEEFSLSQIWVIAGSFGNDLNTIEAGWQVSPQLYGDNSPRFFTYWTTDAYQTTGCYNLLCSGFVQTNSRIAMGAAISPTSGYKGGQFDISLLVWKDPNHGNWWLEFGNGELVGYWPSFLFSHLASHASMVQFGGEVVNTRADGGAHTATQMGSGHFAGEGFGGASYFRNLEVVDWDNSLVPLAAGFHVTADHPDCYDIQGGVNAVWGNYFYYGGPGKNVKCT
ncbi:protein neprosin [Oryza sativa Japonica Group]|uniref:Os01g0547133 protein n=6 Tax=Oryza TaxID=4527 RepID=C7IX77_ORYSJ|nr:uncharacterized protein LOC9266670 [Oryza sativa Japonica Group]XP_052140776.1 uncharacterized protein LOC127760534 [Oryza glaberrima]KAF2950636.1 hypothetical protein DAI22_01g202600 [Oryza sativa Japonica Group]BAH91137.1 Os01g0547133 [Oryza sativa Japonica Group]|eukprot:NP_001172407.1 Os01g0547133 [Oryza sativa Japonica Group]